MGETVVIVSKIKAMVKAEGLRTGGDFIDGLSSRVNQIVSAAVEKVKTEGKKKTLGAEDL
ncbi:MAG: hypothetical protein ABII00_15075 [Elusimicrobiota bacterium]